MEVVDAHHPLGGLEDTEAEPRHVELDRPLCEPGIERHPAAEVVARAEQAEHEVSVGRRRQLTAAPVAGGTRVGSSARRTNHQTAVGRHSGDRAAASADRRDVEHRHVDVVADEATLCHLKRSALVDHCDVGARAADVEGDQLILVDRPYERHRTLNSGGRAGQQRVDRSAAVQHRPEGHQTSIRLHQEELVECKPPSPERIGEVSNVFDEQWLKARLARIVEILGHSRIRGRTSDESDTRSAGCASCRSSPTRRSCSGLTKEKRRQTVTDVMPESTMRAAIARTASSSSPSTTFPEASIRPGTSKMRRSSTSASG